MQLRRFSVLLAAFFAVSALETSADAQNKAGPRAKPAKAVKAAPKAKPATAAKGKKATKTPEPEPDVDADAASSASDDAAPKPTGEGESQVKAAGTSGTTTTPAKPEATTEEDKEGIKTYHFGAIEVESRLKSPQLIYFLRRVRAEFEAGALGHRSFLGELSDTRNDSAFR